MSERCHDTMECRPEDLRCALSIHTQKITDSCRDKDCIEDLRVYLTRESQAVLDTAAAAKVRSAELIYTAIDVSPVAFHRNHYTIDLTFFYKVIADAAVGPCRPAAVCGLALFSKRAVLCGENSGAHIFRSDRPGNTGDTMPTAVVESIDTNSRWKNQTPRLKSRGVCLRKASPGGEVARKSRVGGVEGSNLVSVRDKEKFTTSGLPPLNRLWRQFPTSNR